MSRINMRVVGRLLVVLLMAATVLPSYATSSTSSMASSSESSSAAETILTFIASDTVVASRRHLLDRPASTCGAAARPKDKEVAQIDGFLSCLTAGLGVPRADATAEGLQITNGFKFFTVFVLGNSGQLADLTAGAICGLTVGSLETNVAGAYHPVPWDGGNKGDLEANLQTLPDEGPNAVVPCTPAPTPALTQAEMLIQSGYQSSWAGTDACAFTGVTCDGNGDVIKIDAFPSAPGTALPASWSLLDTLQELDLDERGLTGDLPDSWAALTNLKVLFLSGNDLTGGLPDSWAALTNLETLSLGFNGLTGGLPDSWAALTNLKTLSLNDNDLNGGLPDSWAALTNLRSLFLYDNGLTGGLPDSWAALTNLKTLFLYDNGLTGGLPDSWAALTNLETILDLNQPNGDQLWLKRS
eukprot:jgi/Tetstr1/423352/TSEL_014047.t3